MVRTEALAYRETPRPPGIGRDHLDSSRRLKTLVALARLGVTSMGVSGLK
jgi:hypothetical protein